MTVIALCERADIALAALNEEVKAFNAQVERSLKLEKEIKEVLKQVKQRNNA